MKCLLRLIINLLITAMNVYCEPAQSSPLLWTENLKDYIFLAKGRKYLFSSFSAAFMFTVTTLLQAL